MPRNQTPIWSFKPDVVAFEKMKNRTIENTLAPYDEATRQLNAAIYFSTLVQQVHPDAAYRDRATAMTTKVSSAQTALSLNRQVYLAPAALDITKADPATGYYVQRQLLEFHLAGVDKVPQRPCSGFLLHRRMDGYGQRTGA